ncbi:MAG: GHKL domain-containing protein [Treponema sp.]|nr:GHKL domain-containing protein [Treponema sp.]
MFDFFYLAKLQCVCLLFLVYTHVQMLLAGRKEKLNSYAVSLFYIGECSLFFDGLTAWSVNFIPQVGVVWNIVFHAFFYISLELILWNILLYFLSVTNNIPKRISLQFLLLGVMIAWGIATLYFLKDIKFVQGRTTWYSHGTPVMMVFSLVPVILVLAFALNFKRIIHAGWEKLLPFFTFFVVVVFFSMIQFVYKEAFCSCITVTFTILSIYMNSENPFGRKYDSLRKQFEMEKKYYQRLDEIEQKQAIIRHDEKHFIAALSGLCSEGKISEMEKLLTVMDKSLKKYTPKKYVRNSFLNALLNEKENIALKEGVSIEFQIEPEVDLELISDVDLIALFGNVIDNAVRAEKEYYEDRDGCPSICVKLFETNGNFIMFSVENHYRKIGYANGGLLSTKAQPAEHGIGLKNVRRICGKYGGVFDLDIGTNLFCVNICLPNSSAKIAE